LQWRACALSESWMCGWRRSTTLFPSPEVTERPLGKELGKTRAMANILATQSAEMRAKGEALIQQADRLPCESWDERMFRWRADRSVT
jgi:hypothetical protein